MRFILSFLLFFLVQLCSAGNILGGDLSFSYSEKEYSLTIQPNYSYHFKENWYIGTGIGYNNTDYESSLIIDPFISRNIYQWNNLIFSTSLFSSFNINSIVYNFTGLSLGIRFITPSHFSFYTYFATFGILEDYEFYPSFSFNTNLTLSLSYEFKK